MERNKYSLDNSLSTMVEGHRFLLAEHTVMISELNAEIIKINKKLFSLSIIVFFELAIMLGLLLLFVLK